jgi:hypothetical protein
LEVGAQAAAFGSVINAGSVPLTGCKLAPGSGLRATFSYQATNPQTNQVSGAPNAPFDIPAGGSRSFVFSLTPVAPVAATDVALVFSCPGAGSPAALSGVNMLLFSAASFPVPDVIAVAATPSGDGIATTPSGCPMAFSAAASNAGASSALVVSVDTGVSAMPAFLQIRHRAGTGACRGTPTSALTLSLDANAAATFSVFISTTTSVPLDAGRRRIFVRFTGPDGQTRGSSSAAFATCTLAPGSLRPGFELGLNGRIVQLIKIPFRLRSDRVHHVTPSRSLTQHAFPGGSSRAGCPANGRCAVAERGLKSVRGRSDPERPEHEHESGLERAERAGNRKPQDLDVPNASQRRCRSAR